MSHHHATTIRAHILSLTHTSRSARSIARKEQERGREREGARGRERRRIRGKRARLHETRCDATRRDTTRRDARKHVNRSAQTLNALSLYALSRLVPVTREDKVARGGTTFPLEFFASFFFPSPRRRATFFQARAVHATPSATTRAPQSGARSHAVNLSAR